MDTLRGTFDSGEPADSSGVDVGPDRDAQEHYREDEPMRDPPPSAIGQDERRMQVRAYNHWASLLGERMFPSIEELDPANLPDFGPYSVLLDFTAGIDDPAVQFLGEQLAEECGTNGAIKRLSDVPPRSLLSRITDHYMQIIANQAPIGFEAEFMNQRGADILYRGILLPYSSNDETIDFIYGVINWKEMANQMTADELLLEIDQALDDDGPVEVEAEPHRHHLDPVTDWADSPAHDIADDGEQMPSGSEREGHAAEVGDYGPSLDDFDNIAPFARSHNSTIGGIALPIPDFGQYSLDDPDMDEDEDDGGSYNFASLADYIEAPVKKAIDPAEFPFDDSIAEAEDDPIALTDYSLPEDAGLYDCLAAARELARTARATEDRSRSALYAAVGRAYDFSLAALEAPQDYEELIAESGLTVQERAPMTPVVKLVFGSDYDKTRLTEYAAVLSHAHRLGLERGTLGAYLSQAEGGLKGVVKAERDVRREQAGKQAEQSPALRAALAKKLRELEALSFAALAGEGPEFALLLIRRDEAGEIALLGELDEDLPLIERAARKLVG